MRAPALVDGMRTRDEEMWTVVRKLRDVSKAYTKLRCPEGNGHVHGPYDVVEGSLGKLESANKRGFENCAELIRRFSSLPLPNCSAAPRISRLKLPHPPEWAKGSSGPSWSGMYAGVQRLLRVGRRRLLRRRRRRNRAKRGRGPVKAAPSDRRVCPPQGFRSES
ncbi:hypothetical protein FOZ62_001501 [Perkinsus olseni]|uniref:Uncharacterized protein n=1 Tax=Perkinsus olseni TaxID=32597 RepID=A0A7J6QGU1_PEROL|nr:hypothetical protein FOZ62_001501 [Perkinsus olseni]